MNTSDAVKMLQIRAMSQYSLKLLADVADINPESRQAMEQYLSKTVMTAQAVLPIKSSYTQEAKNEVKSE